MNLGYARVSTREQVLDLQFGVLRPAKQRYEAGQQSTRQFVACFQIGSRRTRYKIPRFAGDAVACPRAGTPAPTPPAPTRA